MAWIQNYPLYLPISHILYVYTGSKKIPAAFLQRDTVQLSLSGNLFLQCQKSFSHSALSMHFSAWASAHLARMA
jgi:hypothetical protein